MSSFYTDDFKREIVSLRQSGKSVIELCKTYNLGKNTVRTWVKEFDSSFVIPKKPDVPFDNKELKALRKDVNALQTQMNIIQELLSTLIKKKGL